MTMEAPSSIISNNNGLIAIHCPDSDDRRKIHDYLDNHNPELCHIGVLIDSRSCNQKTLRRCYDCDQYVSLTYGLGFMENNQEYGKHASHILDGNLWSHFKMNLIKVIATDVTSV